MGCFGKMVIALMIIAAFGVPQQALAGLNTWTLANGPTDDPYYVTSLDVFDSAIHAGTNGGGVFQHDSANGTWSNIGDATNGLADTKVSSLLVHNGILYAGTLARGVFQYNSSRKIWTNVGNTVGNTVYNVSFLVSSGNTIYAAVYGGVFRYDSDTGIWSSIPDATNILANTVVSSLLLHNGILYAGTWAGTFRHDPDGGPG